MSELITRIEAMELITSELRIKKLHPGMFNKYRKLGFISKHDGNKYLKSNILSGMKYIIEYRSKGRFKPPPKRIAIDASSGCNLFLVLMNSRLINN